MLTVELWGANADLYEFVGGVDQMEARLWVTVEKMPMTVTACSFEAEYNGSDNFQNVKLTDATLACAYDTDSPYLTENCLLKDTDTPVAEQVQKLFVLDKNNMASPETAESE